MVSRREFLTTAALSLPCVLHGAPAGFDALPGADDHQEDDEVTRLDRVETALNESLPADPRDTTSPAAMVADLHSVLLGGALARPSRDRLTGWMEANLTGLERLRAGLPATWRAADKTGSNGEHTSNDIAIFWPPGRLPVIVAAYITQCRGPELKRAAMLAKIGELVRGPLR